MEEAVARETDLGAVAKHQDIRESFASNPEQRTHYTSSNGTGSAIEHYSANLTSPSQEYATPAGLVDSLNVGTISRLNQTIHLNLEENVRRNTHPPMLMHPRIGLNLSGGSVQESAQSSDQVNVPGDHVAKTKTRGRPSQSEVARFCGVCGDVAKSFHFGGLSCNSCKAFFRRSVENDLYLQFFCCRGRQSCVITKNNRKTCQHCRMRKCFEIGMQKRWVMTNEERKAAMKARAEKKSGKHVATDAVAASSEAQKDQEQQTSIASLTRESSSNYVPDVSRMTDHMSRAEIKEIEAIVIKYAEAYKQFPYRSELHSGDNKRPGFQIMEVMQLFSISSSYIYKPM